MQVPVELVWAVAAWRRGSIAGSACRRRASARRGVVIAHTRLAPSVASTTVNTAKASTIPVTNAVEKSRLSNFRCMKHSTTSVNFAAPRGDQDRDEELPVISK